MRQWQSGAVILLAIAGLAAWPGGSARAAGDYPTDALRWRRQAWLAAAGSALGLIPLYLYGW